MARSAPHRPLSGLRVLDLTRNLPGPYLTAALVDLGASVVKIEDTAIGDPTRATPPAVPDGSDSAIHAWLNRGKRSVSVDLKTAEGASIVRTLATRSDVLVEGFRPGVMRRLGLDAARLRRKAPQLLYVSLSAVGARGPLSQRAAHDINVAAHAGLLGGGASVSPGLIVDTATAHLALIEILARLRGQGRAGFRGGLVEVSMLDGALALMSASLARAACAPGHDPDELRGAFACYRAYECRDGKRVAVGALEPGFFEALCQGLGHPEHVRHQWSRPRQATLIADFAAAFRAHPRAEWLRRLEPLDACVTPVLEVAEVLEDAQVRTRPGFVRQRAARGSFPSPSFLPGLTGRATRPRAPRLGEHTRDVLRSLGYSKARIDDLRASGVIQ